MTADQRREAVLEHVAAFNAHDSDRLLAGFTDDPVWASGQDVMRGRPALAELFDVWLWGMNPSLTVRSLVADERTVAAELHEEMTVDGERRSWEIAAFFTVRDGLIATAKIYREGVADLEA